MNDIFLENLQIVISENKNKLTIKEKEYRPYVKEINKYGT